MLHTFAAKWISGPVISKRLTQEVMSSFAESSIAVVRFTRSRSCMCFKRGGEISFLFFFHGRNALYGRRHSYQVFNVRNFKINISGFQAFCVLYSEEVIWIHETG